VMECADTSILYRCELKHLHFDARLLVQEGHVQTLIPEIETEERVEGCGKVR
jgi:hypothetical protein